MVELAPAIFMKPTAIVYLVTLLQILRYLMSLDAKLSKKYGVISPYFYLNLPLGAPLRF